MSTKKSNSMKLYAIFSDIAYKNTLKERSDKLKHYERYLGVWKIDDELYNEDVAVFVNYDTTEIVIAIAGSRLNQRKHCLRDLKTNIGILSGTDRLSKRMEDINNLFDAVDRKYQSYTKVVTGHSLGGRMASNLSKQNDITAITYNQGSSPIGEIVDKITNILGIDNKNSKVNQYSTNSIKNGVIDLASISSKIFKNGNQHVTVNTKNGRASNLLNNHSLNHFLPGDEERIGHKNNRWINYLTEYREKHPKTKYHTAMKRASTAYKKYKRNLDKTVEDENKI